MVRWALWTLRLGVVLGVDTKGLAWFAILVSLVAMSVLVALSLERVEVEPSKVCLVGWGRHRCVVAGEVSAVDVVKIGFGTFVALRMKGPPHVLKVFGPTESSVAQMDARDFGALIAEALGVAAPGETARNTVD